MERTLPERGQVDAGHIGSLVAQQPGYGAVGIQSAHAAADKLVVLLRCEGMSKSVERQGPARICVPHLVPVFHNKELQQADGPVGGQLTLRSAHFVVKEADSCQIGFGGGGRFTALLHPKDIAGQMLAADIFQLLQVILIRKISAEPFESLVVSILGVETALAVGRPADPADLPRSDKDFSFAVLYMGYYSKHIQ